MQKEKEKVKEAARAQEKAKEEAAERKKAKKLLPPRSLTVALGGQVLDLANGTK